MVYVRTALPLLGAAWFWGVATAQVTTLDVEVDLQPCIIANDNIVSSFVFTHDLPSTR